MGGLVALIQFISLRALSAARGLASATDLAVSLWLGPLIVTGEAHHKAISTLST